MAATGEYVGRVLRVNLTEGSLGQDPLDEAFTRDYIGGRGFTSRLQYDLIPRDVNPLGPYNVLIIAPGALTGTSAPSASRFVVAARSPLTGILGDANSGGFLGAVLKRAGYDLVLIHGRSPHPVYLCIDDAAAEPVKLYDASHLWGRDVHDTTDALKQEHGRGFCVATIGPAGENLVRMAAVMADKEHAAARTGLGAVMGSKNLKAIAVRSGQDFPYHDQAAFNGLVAELIEIEHNDRRAQDFSARGTLGTLMDHHSAIGGMNTRNFQFGQFEGKEKVDHDALAAEYLVRPTGCYRCSLKCDRHSRVEEGEFAGVQVDGPEYSTAVALGSGLGIDNMAAILKGNDLANRYGLDTIDLGGVIAFAMELYQRGILSREEADGLDLEWGNYHTMLELTRRIALREGPFADLLAHGVRAAAEEIGRGAERYAVHVKGMTPAPLDARAVKVYNFRYAVSPRGADHLRISAPGAYALDSMPLHDAADRLRYWESVVAVPDLMGVCKFAYTYYTETPDVALHRTLDILPSLYTAATGRALTRDDLLHTAARVINVERAHNCRLGMTSADDTLPPRFTQDPMPAGPAKGKVYDILEPMKEAWYTVQGWDPTTGIPTRAILEKLELDDIADDLEQNTRVTLVHQNLSDTD
ncbi:MAG: aldehyde ferredoxin oxidoreductase family protein [Anaerolineae bacterium]|nr:aldehyde ferredoxin oxidoreductase family protein [Anaerolineae bacterium]